MMSEKRQRKKNVKTGEGEPQIRVTEEVEGRVAGPAKTLMDANVYDLMAEEEMPPPPPYTSNSGADKTRMSSSFRLAGETKLFGCNLSASAGTFLCMRVLKF